MSKKKTKINGGLVRDLSPEIQTILENPDYEPDPLPVCPECNHKSPSDLYCVYCGSMLPRNETVKIIESKQGKGSP